MSRPPEQGAAELSQVCWPQLVARREPLLVVPLGSCEQHGPHLPFGADTAVAGAVAAGLAGRNPHVVLAPPLAYGASGEHEGFPGTLSIGTAATSAVLVELGRSAGRWADRLLFVTGHGGNGDALRSAVPLLREEGRDAAWWACGVAGGDAHAGRTETSLLLALDPALVRADEMAAGCTTPLREILPQLRAGGVAAVSSSGILGDPTGASGDEGRTVLTGLVHRLTKDVSGWRVAEDGRLLPPRGVGMTRVAVVTGAARGIGAAVAVALAADGWSLALGDVCADDAGLSYALADEHDLQSVAAACRDLGAGVTAIVADVRRPEQVAALATAAAALGDVQAAVAVAGVLGGSGLAWQLEPGVVERDLAVNYLGVVELARATVPRLLAAGTLGRFVAVVSAAGAAGLPLLASYSASKHAALGYVRALAADLAPSGVTANAVLPGSTDTPLLAATAKVYDLPSAATFARHQRTGRLLQPQEVAATVAWLASPGASGVTGAAVPVDGGFTG